MEGHALLIASLVIIYVTFKLLDRTDVPKIKNLPSIPGVPIFGNLLQLGEEHAKNAAGWVKKFGPVFQVRLGNRVIYSHHPCGQSSRLVILADTFISEIHLRKHL